MATNFNNTAPQPQADDGNNNAGNDQLLDLLWVTLATMAIAVVGAILMIFCQVFKGCCVKKGPTATVAPCTEEGAPEPVVQAVHPRHHLPSAEK
jgi:hypothetical protein